MYGETSGAGVLAEDRREGWETLARDNHGGRAISSGEEGGQRERSPAEAEKAGSVLLTRSERVPTLDGIRGVAIGLVLMSHTFMRVKALAFPGQLGVSIFLVLSGFLITRVMLADEERSGSLRLGRFYWRRAVRILPALYAFLAALALLSAAGIIAVPSRQEWFSAFFYFRNIIDGNWETGHLWSLSLEEQFYFCWPALFILTRRFRFRFIASAVVLMTIFRAWFIYTHPVGRDLFVHPALRMDTFLIGGAFAIGKRSWARAVPACSYSVLLMFWFLLSAGLPIIKAVSTPVSAFLIGSLIVWSIESRGPVSRMLSSRVLSLIGELSYSIYLWQQLFLGEAKLYWWSFPALAVVCVVSYHFIERPAVRLKDLKELKGTAIAARSDARPGIRGVAK